MSNEETRIKRSKRKQQKWNHINDQLRLVDTTIPFEKSKYLRQPHRLYKMNAMNCGNPKCFLCMNPRRLFKEKTLHEKSFVQRELLDYDIYTLPSGRIKGT